MTVIRPNSVSGITSITAQANEINFFRSNGALAGLQLNGVNFNTTTGVSTFNNLDVGGVLTYQDVTNVDSVGIITARSTIDAQGDVSIADKIVHTGDTNTSLRFPAADTITAETAGTERVRIDSIGRVMIGTTTAGESSADELTVANSGHAGMTIRSGTSSWGSFFFSDGTSGGAQYDGAIEYKHSDNYMRFRTAQTERFRIGSSGQLGIAGANYGSSGQVLTSQGSGSAPQWATPSSDLVNDTSPQLGGNLDSNGNNIKLGDSSSSNDDRLQIGAATFGDLELFHDGTNSYIDNATNDLFIRNTGDDIIIQAADNITLAVQGGENGIAINGNGEVELFHDGTQVVETHGSGLTFNQGSGNLIKYGTTSEFPNAAINISRGGNGYANIRLSSNYGCGIYLAGANNNTDEFSINQDNQKNGYVDNRGGFISFNTGSSGTQRMKIENSAQITFMGDALPSSNNSYDIGSSSNRWRNIYTNDLNLSNQGSTNTVDNTWGDYTIQEGENDLFLINNRSGKKYKFNLTEVS